MNFVLHRRHLPAILFGLLGIVAGVISYCISQAADSSKPKVTRENILRDIAQNVVAPAYADLALRCRALSEAAAVLRERPDSSAFNNTRDRWSEVALSAQKISCFKIGPVVDGGYAPAFYFGPVRAASIDRVLNSKELLSESRIEELGAAAKGLCAIEFLIFQPSTDGALEKLTGEKGERRRLYLHLLAAELARQSERLAKEWQTPLSPSAARFIDGGQTSVNLLVNQLAWSLENLNEKRLRPLVAPAEGDEPSGGGGGAVSRMIARMQGTQQIYSGGAGVGIDDLLRHLNSPLPDRLDEEFRRSLAALAELDRPLKPGQERTEQARSAYELCRGVEMLIKVDMTSALGVTLTFSPIDGD